ncbi:mRNA cleavage and polyadenylation factor CLP1 [Sphaceloma murrayae]|uniref:mRNA cleavage and polyadenylation factor CLP1 n=1 Tax=Sphaceloma murrayae TaxID=2082308 RepID=A0A2K1QSS6_9PEZI|nr:mRNA cleavage and polyadenylation factor CLP1 [Sphaceloma murrayae]
MGLSDVLRVMNDEYGISGTMLFTVLGALFSIIMYVNLFHVDKDYVRAPRDPALPPATEISELRIYPIKSCRGISVRETHLKMSGLDLDRNWMFVDAADMKFLTIRSDPTMTLIDTSINDEKDELTVSIHGTKDSVTIPAHPKPEWLRANNTLEKVEIWGNETDGWTYSANINDMFSSYFKKPVKLVYKGPSPRMSAGNGSKELSGRDVPHHFADLMSVQIASESSLADLNRRLKEQGYAGERLTIERFRPNIVIRGNDAWEEDRWKTVQITTVDHDNQLLWRTGLDVVCRCARCQVPNVNPDTAEKHAHEPWDTLMKFRRVDQGGPAKWKPCFGMLCLPQKEGPIRLGSKFEVMGMTDKHLYNTAKFEDL